MKPADELELAQMIRATTGPLRILGGGTRALGPQRKGELLETGGLSGISLYEPGALTIVAGAGTPLAEVESALAAEGQRLPFEVPDLRGLLGRQGASTIGGVVAANASGPRRIQAGACRDSLIGVRFVDGAGTVLKNGGRVMKNVTGYDLVKLMAGAHGTLGVLTEVAFKVLPRPEVEATLVKSDLTPEQAVQAMAAALGSPFEVTGAGYVAGQLRLRIEGMAGSVAYRTSALAKLLGAGWDVAEAAQSAALWAELRDVKPLAGPAGAVWRISVKPSDIPKVLALVGTDTVCDWGGGLIWALVSEEGDVMAGQLRGLVAQIGGHATLVRASDETYAQVPAFQPEPPELAVLAAGLRARFDPRGLLNPGLMG
ncbi:glycolate oxidase subunit GlcE [Pseudorhodobacter turbinis]|uniref:Glycolate oxidase subunit GlcE n=1 Tax=Pseudorhodobacter turbinis TaxID=2500533 RepID=A0A4P8EDT9_9RHOB|nr:glycolate oxidase subunit GlcE [Pseudorhodobacter turbinis]QCO55161.1 glycolate oxidase subunit GlcE [Pseudorhodobacter turbinis]